MPEQLAEKNAVYLLYHPPMNIARTGHAGPGGRHLALRPRGGRGPRAGRRRAPPPCRPAAGGRAQLRLNRPA